MGSSWFGGGDDNSAAEEEARRKAEEERARKAAERDAERRTAANTLSEVDVSEVVEKANAKKGKKATSLGGGDDTFGGGALG